MIASNELKIQPAPDVEYPEEDGLPMPEGDPQREYLSYATKVLRIFFQERTNVYVSGNLFIYYEKGNNKASVAPDTFVVFGVSNKDRGTYKVWEENGKLPAFALEISSASTWEKDQRNKPELYGKLGVREFFQYDPTGEFLKPRSLQGVRLVDGVYENIVATELADGVLSLPSETLGLEVRLYPDKGLRFYDPISGEFLRSHEEEVTSRLKAELERSLEQQARIEAEAIAEEERFRAEQASLAQQQAEAIADQERQEKEQERLAKEQAEQKARRLAERLRSLGLDPDEI